MPRIARIQPAVHVARHGGAVVPPRRHDPRRRPGLGHLELVPCNLRAAVVLRLRPREVDLRLPGRCGRQPGRGVRHSRIGGGVGFVRVVALADRVDRGHPVVPSRTRIEPGVGMARERGARVGHKGAPGRAGVLGVLDHVARDIGAAVVLGGLPLQVDPRLTVGRGRKVERRTGLSRIGGGRSRIGGFRCTPTGSSRRLDSAKSRLR